MADDFDVEAMLEEAVDRSKDSKPVYSNGSRNDNSSGNESEESPKKDVKNGHRSSSREGDDKSKKKRARSRSRSSSPRHRRDRKRSSSRERRRRPSRTREDKEHSRQNRHRRSSSRDRKSRSREKGEHRRHDRERDHDRRERSRERPSYRRDDRRSPPPRDRRDYRARSPIQDLPIEERDQRTVFCMQLAARVRQYDLEDFFQKAGQVREVRLIMDSRTRRHKGIAYIEFKEIDSVGKAIALTGTRLCGVPIVVQHSQAEKNRLAASNAAAKSANGAGAMGLGRGQPMSGPMNLYIGSLHFNITEEMLTGIFEPFGKVDKIEVSRDPETGRSKGYGFVHFREAADAKKALEQLNGFELAGRPMKVNYVTEKSSSDFGGLNYHNPETLDSDETDRTGIELGARGRLQLMAKLAEGTGIELPKAAVSALASNGASCTAQASQTVATPCFLLTNMFNPREETSENWADDIKNDVVEECRKHGGVIHVYVDTESEEGYVYVKCASVAAANATVNALHGRWFAGRMILASYVPLQQYHSLFPVSSNSTTLL